MKKFFKGVVSKGKQIIKDRTEEEEEGKREGGLYDT
jgi:hypothetical protein